MAHFFRLSYDNWINLDQITDVSDKDYAMIVTFASQVTEVDGTLRARSLWLRDKERDALYAYLANFSEGLVEREVTP